MRAVSCRSRPGSAWLRLSPWRRPAPPAAPENHPPWRACPPSGRKACRRRNRDSPAVWLFGRATGRSRRWWRGYRSCRPSRSPVQRALNSFSRTARSASDTSSGCWVVFCSGMTNLPFRPRLSASWAAVAIWSSVKSGQIRLVVQHQRAGLGGGHQFLLEGGFQAGVALVDRLAAWSCRRRTDWRRHGGTGGNRWSEAAALPDRASARRAGHRPP